MLPSIAQRLRSKLKLTGRRFVSSRWDAMSCNLPLILITKRKAKGHYKVFLLYRGLTKIIIRRGCLVLKLIELGHEYDT